MGGARGFCGLGNFCYLCGKMGGDGAAADTNSLKP